MRYFAAYMVYYLHRMQTALPITYRHHQPSTLAYVTDGRPIGTPPGASPPDDTTFSKLTYHPCLLKMIANAMMEWPLFRTSFTPTTDTNKNRKPTLTIRPSADVALAIHPNRALLPQRMEHGRCVWSASVDLGREDMDHFRALTELKWGEFKSMGFRTLEADEKELYVDLTGVNSW